MRVLAADVGGTKTLLALYEGEPGRWRAVAVQRFASAEHAGPAPIIAQLCAAHPGRVDAAALGVAGPVQGDACRATNLPWHIDAREIERDTGIARVGLLNDFSAIALGLGELGEGQLHVLADRPADPRGVAAVIGAGTGLGEAILLPQDGLPAILPSEGGHCDFAPRDEIEIGLLQFLLQRHAHVSYERVLSGPGLVSIYEHVRESGLAPSDGALLEGGDPAAAIGKAAMAGSDRAAECALAIFVSVYGAEAGNLALKVLPRGGLYIAGGIAPKILGAMTGGVFLDAFLAKGRMRDVLADIRVSIVTEPAVGLLGARRLAATLA